MRNLLLTVRLSIIAAACLHLFTTAGYALTTPSTGAIAAGNSHTISLKSDGTVWAWGFNDSGQLGDGTTMQRTFPVEVNGLSEVVAVASGASYTVALKSDGTVWAWGGNTSGQLGDGTTTQRASPAQVNGLSEVVAVAGGAGAAHVVALKSDGTVWAWGNNTSGQLGDGMTMQRATPLQVSGLSGAVAVTGGQTHTVALKSDGTVWAWGDNTFGQLGDGTTTERTSPVQVNGLSEVVAVASGASYTVALKSDGTVWAWGGNTSGQLGDGTTTQRTSPAQVNGLSEVVAVAGGGGHTVALKSDGTVWTWGSNTSGQLGDGTTTERTSPVQVAGLNGAMAVAAGYTHTVTMKSDGTVLAWGRNTYGQLGEGTTTQRTSPVQINGLSGVVAVASGDVHTMAVKSDGTVWTWGSNIYGQLGDGATTQRTTPVQVSGLSGVVAAAGGGRHTVALKNDGTVWAWGSNRDRQLGDRTRAQQRTTPVKVSGLSGAVAVAAGQSHTVALTNDGRVWAWGDNSYGKLGDSRNTSIDGTPAVVRGLNGVISVSCGDSYTVVLKSDGTVWTWGFNVSAPFNGISWVTPAKVSGLSGIVAVAGGGIHTVALKGDGTVWAWGRNNYGQLGDGTRILRATPVQVSGLSGIVAVVGGEVHTAALKSDGTVWAWGSNADGQLGDGTVAQLWTTPVQVSGLSGVVALAAGGGQTIALKSDGTIRGWGYSSSGQSGNALTPIQSAIRLIPASDDVNQNGVSDAWEMSYFENLSHSGGADPDGDGLTNIQEFAKGSDPSQQDADGDLLTDFVDDFPFDYYNAVAPTLSLLSGDNQVAAPGTFNANPFDIAVWNAGATSPLVNAPVTFTVTSGGGTLAEVLTDTPANPITLLSDEVGTVQAHYKHADSLLSFSVVTVTAGSAQLQINTRSATVQSDYDGDFDDDGMPNGWEHEHGLNPYNPADAGLLVGDFTNLQLYQQSLAEGSDPLQANALGLVVYSP